MQTPTRRSVMLTGAASSLTASVLAAEADQALTVSDNPTSLLAEHRRRAARYFALEAHYKRLDDIAYDAVVGSFPPDYVAETDEEVQAAFADYDRDRKSHQRLLDAAKTHVGEIDRRIWAIPAATWDDIVFRAELAEFWNRGWRLLDHHGYDDPFADRRLADAILVDQPARPSARRP